MIDNTREIEDVLQRIIDSGDTISYLLLGRLEDSDDRSPIKDWNDTARNAIEFILRLRAEMSRSGK